MSRQPGLSEWIDLVSTHMPHLSVPQARVFALWSYGIRLPDRADASRSRPFWPC